MRRFVALILICSILGIAGCSEKKNETDLTFLGMELKDASSIVYHNAEINYIPDVVNQKYDYDLVSALCKIYNKKQSQLMVETCENVEYYDAFESDNDNKYYFVLNYPEIKTIHSRECDEVIVCLNDTIVYLAKEKKIIAKLYWDHSMKDEIKDVEKHYDKIIAVIDMIRKDVD